MDYGLDCRIDKLTIGACRATNLACIVVTFVVIDSGLLVCNRIGELADAENHTMCLDALSKQ